MQARSILLVILLLAAVVGGVLLVQGGFTGDGDGLALDGQRTTASETEAADIRGDALDPDKRSTERAPERVEGERSVQRTAERESGKAAVRARIVQERRPLAGVQVRLVQHGVAFRRPQVQGRDTDTDGKVLFDNVAPGEYALGVSGEGVPVGFHSPLFTLGPDENKDLGDVLVSVAARLIGRVLNRDGVPVAEALVQLGRGSMSDFLGSSMGVLNKRTDRGGRFELDSVLEGDYVLRVDHPEFSRHEQRVSPRSAKTTDVGDLRLAEGRRLDGQIVNSSGRAIAGVEVSPKQVSTLGTTIARGYSKARAVKTDENGRFHLGGLSSRVDLKAEAAGYQTILDHAVDKDATFVKLTMLEECFVAGRVLGGRSPTEATTRVNLRRVGEPGPVLIRANRTEKTDENGFFRVTGLVPGSYRIQADQDGFGFSEAREITVGPRGLSDLKLALVQGPSLEVRLQDSTGNPVAEATVEVRKGRPRSYGGGLEVEIVELGRPTRQAKSDAEGKALIEGLFVGTATLRVRHPSFLEVVQRERLTHGANSRVVVLERGGWIEGVCLDENGAPLPGAKVIIKPGRGEEENNVRRIRRRRVTGPLQTDNVVADKSGEFRSKLLKPGPYTVGLGTEQGAMSYQGRDVSVRFGEEEQDRGSRVTVEVAVDNGSRVVLRKSITGTLLGKVLFRGEPIGGSRVFAWPDGTDSFQARRAVADSNGAYRLASLSPGSWRVCAKPPKGPIASDPVKVEIHSTGGERNQVIVLGGGVVLGRVDRTGPEVGTLQALLRQRSDQPISRRVAVMVTADDSGRSPNMSTMSMRPPNAPEPVPIRADASFEIRYVPAGSWELVIQSTEQVNYATRAIELQDNDTKDLGSIPLARIFPVKIEIVDEAGETVPFGFLEILKPSADGKELVNVHRGLVRQGSTKIPGLAAGKYELRFRRIDPQKGQPEEPQKGTLEVHKDGRVTGSRLRLER